MEDNKLQKKYELVKSTIDRLEHTKTGELYLFVVGIDSYLKERNLHYCKKDANEFINIFHKYNNIKKKNIYSLFDESATKRNILSRLDGFRKILNTNDRLIIYFAGHGHNTDFSNFFIPHDGNQDNYISCITNNFIAESITELQSDFILLFYDLNFSKVELTDYKKKRNIDYLTSLRTEITHNKIESSLYKEFISFFSKRSQSKVKEAFCFLKDENFKTSNLSINLNLDSDKRLNELLEEKYNTLLKLLKEQKTEQVLHTLNSIVENNDTDLQSRVETLLFKLNEINAAQKSKRDAILEDKVAINQITCEVIERINKNGFYLIKTPKSKTRGANREKPRTRILFTSANPRDENFLRLNQEAKDIEFALMKAKYRDNFEFIKIKALDIAELQDVLLNQTPQFLHFSGHGNCDGIVLLNENDNAKLVNTKPLADLFKLFSQEIKCVFLNSCHSISQSEEISKYIKKVVCMSQDVPDHVAIHFATAFYKSIGAGKDIDFSFYFAKNSIELNGIKGSNIPVLLPQN